VTLVPAYLRRQIDEIADDPVLRAYGAVLALTNLLTAYWLLQGGYAGLVARGEDAFCWPLVPECERFRWLDAGQLEVAFWIYGAASLVVALLFLRRSDAARGWLGLAALTAFKIAVVALDFRLRRNQHYMAFAVTGVFLLVPRKRQAVPLLLVLFYFWAGTLKLNREWLSGAALYRPLPLFAGRGIVAACAYVVVMELAIVWGLLARRPAIFWASLAQVLVFHAISWWIVGFFYPTLMFLLLAIFPLGRLRPVAMRPLAPSTSALAAAFSLVQLSTHLYPGDTAITGEGRLFALHMFDARVECEPVAVVHLENGHDILVDMTVGAGRTHCDPVMITGAARNLCRRKATGQLDFVDLDLRMDARRATDTEMQRVIEIDGFCANPPRYSPFLHNDWIRAR